MKEAWVYSGAAALALGAVLYFNCVGSDRTPLTSDPARALKSYAGERVVENAPATSPRASRSRKSTRGKRATKKPLSASDSRDEFVGTTRSQEELGKGKTLFGERRLEAPPRAVNPVRQAALERRRARAETLNPRVERRLATLRAELATAPRGELRALQLDIEALERNLGSRQRRAAGIPGAAKRARSGG